MSASSLPRFVVSLLLVAAHLLVATHSAFAAHELSLSGSGEVQHRHQVLRDPTASHQQHAQASWCGSPTESAPGADLTCTAAKVGQLPTALQAGQAPLEASGGDGAQTASGHRWARNPLAVLCWAPKASPPRAASS